MPSLASAANVDYVRSLDAGQVIDCRPFHGQAVAPILAAMRFTRANPRGHAAAAATAAMAAVVLVSVGALLPAGAQTTAPARANPPTPPRVIVIPNDIYRGPPAPPERQIAPPRSSQEISPAMPRLEALPQMTPRVGN